MIDEETCLAHYGIKGMHWGVRRYQNPDGSLTPEGQARYTKRNLRHAKIRNLDKWGKDRNHNVLYIIGASGSGKSTTALGLARKNDSIIHLDTLFEDTAHGTSARNKDFEEYCMTKGIDVPKARDITIPKKERWRVIDAIGDQVEPYGRHCYNDGRRVIIEGVQMADDTMFPNKRYFKTRPTITLHTRKLRSAVRAAKRDKTNLKDFIKDVTDKDRYEWYDYIEENLKKINNQY